MTALAEHGRAFGLPSFAPDAADHWQQIVNDSWPMDLAGVEA